MTVEIGPLEFSVVVYPEVDRNTGTIAWIAQCLEYDIASQGGSVAQAKERLDRKIDVTFLVSVKEGSEPFARIRRAPQKFWDMFSAASEALVHDETPRERLPRKEPKIKSKIVKLAA